MTTFAAATPIAAVPAAVTGYDIAPYGSPSTYERDDVRRTYPGGPALTPLASQLGSLTPSGLHFVRDHAGTPSIDPATHRLYVHGLVRRPLSFTAKEIARFPAVERPHFIECAGNSAPGWQRLGIGVQFSHGLVSNSMWFGVPVRTVLEEAGLATGAAWVIAEGADDASFDRSIPLEKMLDDAMIAYGQNGEPLRPEQGYPFRLLLPGYEGSASIKWLRRLKVTSEPVYSREETSQYSDVMPDGSVKTFDFVMGPKSVITSPSPGQTIRPGFVEMRGFAWSGNGRVTGVDVSFDGGTTWKSAAFRGDAPPKAFVSFAAPFVWDGSPLRIASRAVDETGAVQPSAGEFVRRRGASARYHVNAIATWSVGRDGGVGLADA